LLTEVTPQIKVRADTEWSVENEPTPTSAFANGQTCTSMA
jgi:hypothetical protein